MRELVELNRYLHDFASAVWIVGSIVLWMLMKEWRRDGIVAETALVIARIAGQMRTITIPALIITLCSGGVRALTFSKYEYVGEITTSVIVSLAVKHVVFALIIGWGVWIHWQWRGIPKPSQSPS